MPQQMRGPATGAFHARAANCLVDDMRDGRRGEGTKRWTAANKQRIGIGAWPTFFEVGHNRVTNLLGQRQSGMTAALTTNMNPGALPVDVTQPEMHDIPRPKAQTGQQEQDGPMPQSYGRSLIAGSNQAFHLFRLKIAWQRGQAPMSCGGDGGIQPHDAFTFGDQKTQEHAKRRGALLGYRRPP